MELFINHFSIFLAFAGISIKIWGKKGGEFAGTCASQSPFLTRITNLRSLWKMP